MSLPDVDPVMTGLHLLIVVLGTGMVAFGARVAVSRQFPAAWIRLTRLAPHQQAQPVRMGGAQALLGAGLVIQQVPFLLSVSYPVGAALFAVSLLTLLGAAVLFARLRY